ncbi:hypothetical protein DIPPA_10215 [Diplonema papillatum]|nr:hypothetical protein DIPPA_10215 [Diplonema papillatum]
MARDGSCGDDTRSAPDSRDEKDDGYDEDDEGDDDDEFAKLTPMEGVFLKGIEERRFALTMRSSLGGSYARMLKTADLTPEGEDLYPPGSPASSVNTPANCRKRGAPLASVVNHLNLHGDDAHTVLHLAPTLRIFLETAPVVADGGHTSVMDQALPVVVRLIDKHGGSDDANDAVAELFKCLVVIHSRSDTRTSEAEMNAAMKVLAGGTSNTSPGFARVMANAIELVNLSADDVSTDVAIRLTKNTLRRIPFAQVCEYQAILSLLERFLLDDAVIQCVLPSIHYILDAVSPLPKQRGRSGSIVQSQRLYSSPSFRQSTPAPEFLGTPALCEAYASLLSQILAEDSVLSHLTGGGPMLASLASFTCGGTPDKRNIRPQSEAGWMEASESDAGLSALLKASPERLRSLDDHDDARPDTTINTVVHNGSLDTTVHDKDEPPPGEADKPAPDKPADGEGEADEAKRHETREFGDFDPQSTQPVGDQIARAQMEFRDRRPTTATSGFSDDGMSGSRRIAEVLVTVFDQAMHHAEQASAPDPHDVTCTGLRIIVNDDAALGSSLAAKREPGGVVAVPAPPKPPGMPPLSPKRAPPQPQPQQPQPQAGREAEVTGDLAVVRVLEAMRNAMQAPGVTEELAARRIALKLAVVFEKREAFCDEALELACSTLEHTASAGHPDPSSIPFASLVACIDAHLAPPVNVKIAAAALALLRSLCSTSSNTSQKHLPAGPGWGVVFEATDGGVVSSLCTALTQELDPDSTEICGEALLRIASLPKGLIALCSAGPADSMAHIVRALGAAAPRTLSLLLRLLTLVLTAAGPDRAQILTSAGLVPALLSLLNKSSLSNALSVSSLSFSSLTMPPVGQATGSVSVHCLSILLQLVQASDRSVENDTLSLTRPHLAGKAASEARLKGAAADAAEPAEGRPGQVESVSASPTSSDGVDRVELALREAEKARNARDPPTAEALVGGGAQREAEDDDARAALTGHGAHFVVFDLFRNATGPVQHLSGAILASICEGSSDVLADVLKRGGVESVFQVWEGKRGDIELGHVCGYLLACLSLGGDEVCGNIAAGEDGVSLISGAFKFPSVYLSRYQRIFCEERHREVIKHKSTVLDVVDELKKQLEDEKNRTVYLGECLPMLVRQDYALALQHLGSSLSFVQPYTEILRAIIQSDIITAVVALLAAADVCNTPWEDSGHFLPEDAIESSTFSSLRSCCALLLRHEYTEALASLGPNRAVFSRERELILQTLLPAAVVAAGLITAAVAIDPGGSAPAVCEVPGPSSSEAAQQDLAGGEELAALKRCCLALAKGDREGALCSLADIPGLRDQKDEIFAALEAEGAAAAPVPATSPSPKEATQLVGEGSASAELAALKQCCRLLAKGDREAALRSLADTAGLREQKDEILAAFEAEGAPAAGPDALASLRSCCVLLLRHEYAEALASLESDRAAFSAERELILQTLLPATVVAAGLATAAVSVDPEGSFPAICEVLDPASPEETPGLVGDGSASEELAALKQCCRSLAKGDHEGALRGLADAAGLREQSDEILAALASRSAVVAAVSMAAGAGSAAEGDSDAFKRCCECLAIGETEQALQCLDDAGGLGEERDRIARLLATRTAAAVGQAAPSAAPLLARCCQHLAIHEHAEAAALLGTAAADPSVHAARAAVTRANTVSTAAAASLVAAACASAATAQGPRAAAGPPARKGSVVLDERLRSVMAEMQVLRDQREKVEERLAEAESVLKAGGDHTKRDLDDTKEQLKRAVEDRRDSLSAFSQLKIDFSTSKVAVENVKLENEKLGKEKARLEAKLTETAGNRRAKGEEPPSRYEKMYKREKKRADALEKAARDPIDRKLHTRLEEENAVLRAEVKRLAGSTLAEGRPRHVKKQQFLPENDTSQTPSPGNPRHPLSNHWPQRAGSLTAINLPSPAGQHRHSLGLQSYHQPDKRASSPLPEVTSRTPPSSTPQANLDNTELDAGAVPHPLPSPKLSTASDAGTARSFAEPESDFHSPPLVLPEEDPRNASGFLEKKVARLEARIAAYVKAARVYDSAAAAFLERASKDPKTGAKDLLAAVGACPLAKAAAGPRGAPASPGLSSLSPPVASAPPSYQRSDAQWADLVRWWRSVQGRLKQVVFPVDSLLHQASGPDRDSTSPEACVRELIGCLQRGPLQASANSAKFAGLAVGSKLDAVWVWWLEVIPFYNQAYVAILQQRHAILHSLSQATSVNAGSSAHRTTSPHPPATASAQNARKRRTLPNPLLDGER